MPPGLACSSSPGPTTSAAGSSTSAASTPWQISLASPGLVSGRAIAVSSESVVVAGNFESTLELPGSALHSSGATDGFVAFLDRDGRVAWARSLGGMGQDSIRALAMHARFPEVASPDPGSGAAPAPDAISVTVALTHGDAIDLGDLGDLAGAPGAAVDATGLADDPFAGNPDSATALITLDGSGRLTRVTPLRASRYIQVSALEYSDDGALTLAGLFTGTVRVGDHVLTSAGASDLLVARIAPAGEVSWAIRAGGAGADSAAGLAVSRSAVAVAGSFSGRAVFATTTVVAPRRNRRVSGQSGFVAVLDPGTGALRWLTPLLGPATSATAVAMNEQAIACAGHFEGPMKLGETTLDARGGADGFAVGLDLDGQVTWLTRIGGEGLDHATAIAAHEDRFYLVGTFHDRAISGDHRLTGAGEQDIFVGSISAAGKLLAVRSFGGPGHDAVGGVAVSPRGLHVTGTFSGTATISGPLRAAGPLGAFVARLPHRALERIATAD